MFPKHITEHVTFLMDVPKLSKETSTPQSTEISGEIPCLFHKKWN